MSWNINIDRTNCPYKGTGWDVDKWVIICTILNPREDCKEENCPIKK